MGFLYEGLDFTVRVDGDFLSRGRWMIVGIIDYRARLNAPTRERLEHATRFELMRGLAQQIDRGHHLCAWRIDVVIEGDAEVAGLFEVFHAEREPGQAA